MRIVACGDYDSARCPEVFYGKAGGGGRRYTYVYRNTAAGENSTKGRIGELSSRGPSVSSDYNLTSAALARLDIGYPGKKLCREILSESAPDS
jgi:hypothetical protein